MKKKDLLLNDLENETIQVIDSKISTTKKRRKYKHSIKSKKIRSLIKQIQIAIKKNQRIGVGKVNTEQVKKYIKKHGTKVTIEHLMERYQYTIGLANPYAVYAITDRIKRGFSDITNPNEKKMLRELLNNMKKRNISEKELQDILKIIYNEELSINKRLQFACERSRKFGSIL